VMLGLSTKEHKTWVLKGKDSREFTLQRVADTVKEALSSAGDALSLHELEGSQSDANNAEDEVRRNIKKAEDHIKRVYDLILRDQTQADQLTKSMRKSKLSDFNVVNLFKHFLKVAQAKAEKKVKAPTIDGYAPKLSVTIRYWEHWERSPGFTDKWTDAKPTLYPLDISLDVVIWNAKRVVSVPVELENQPRLYEEKKKDHKLTESGLSYHSHMNNSKLSAVDGATADRNLVLYLVICPTGKDNPVFVVYGFNTDFSRRNEDVSHLIYSPESTFSEFEDTVPIHSTQKLVYANPSTNRGYVRKPGSTVTWNHLKRLFHGPPTLVVAIVCINPPRELEYIPDTTPPANGPSMPLPEPIKVAAATPFSFDWWRNRFEKDKGRIRAPAT